MTRATDGTPIVHLDEIELACRIASAQIDLERPDGMSAADYYEVLRDAIGPDATEGIRQAAIAAIRYVVEVSQRAGLLKSVIEPTSERPQ